MSELSIPAPKPDNGGRKEISLPAPRQEVAQPARVVDKYRGVAEGCLSKEEIAILCAPVNDEEVCTFPPSAGKRAGLLYVPHTHYRNRYNKVVGPSSWAIVKDAEPVYDAQECMVYWSGTLYVRGHYIGSAVGQQLYTKGKNENSRMTYGDAVEGAKSDCLVRCSKDLGMFWELWDPNWISAWKARQSKKKPEAPKPSPQAAPEPLIVPDTQAPVEAPQNILDSVAPGDVLTLDGHSCGSCTLNKWEVQIAKPNEPTHENHGKWYIRCATDHCFEEVKNKKTGSVNKMKPFGGWWEDIKAKYSEVASVKEV